MINLLSPTLKEQISYAKRNAVAIKYLKILIFVLAVVLFAFGGAWFYLDQKMVSAKASFADKQTKVASYKKLEEQAKILNDRIAAIKSIQENQPRFSQLLVDIAQAMPKNAALEALNLTGDDKKPIRITASADTYATAVSLRDALAQSPRISAVDLETVGTGANGVTVTLTIAFKPGQAR